MLKTIRVNKVIATGGVNSAADVISNNTSAGIATAWEFSRCPEEGYIVRAIVAVKTTSLTSNLTLYLFKALPTCELRDNVANTAVLNADKDNYIGRIDFPSLDSQGGVSEAIAVPSSSGNLPLAIRPDNSTNSIWGVLVSRTACTVTSGDDINISLMIDS